MKLTNNEIYTYAPLLTKEFGVECEIKFPIKVNFFLQKNIRALMDAAKEIDEARTDIAKRYGELSEDGSYYTVPDDRMEEASKELADLFALEQELSIHSFDINDFGNDISLTTSQMDMLMFMID